MRLDSLEGNRQRLDGGAMFGNVPKAMWEKWCPPDERNRIALACRSLLARTDDGKTVLLEAGIGAFFEPKLRERYGVIESSHILLQSLQAIGVAPEDIDIIVLSHLHFDHAGGLLTPWDPNTQPQLLFPNAHYVIGERAWERALNPHPRDRASFIPGLTEKLEQTGRIHLHRDQACDLLGPKFSMTYVDGHTPGMMLTRIEHPDGPITFMGDLIPGMAWIHAPITMGYDRFAELVIDEKKEALQRILAEQGRLFFTHDDQFVASFVKQDERGRYRGHNPVASLTSASPS